jgi:hypothetical protein
MTRSGDFHGLPMLVFWFEVATLACLSLTAACNLWAEHRGIEDPAKRPFAVRLLGVTAVVALFLALGLFLSFGVEWLAMAVLGRPIALLGMLGAVLGIALSSIAIQVVSNAGRRTLGMPTRPFRWSAVRPRVAPPGASTTNKPVLEGAPGSVPWFAAMEYYRLILNRTYKVFVGERMLCGAKVGGAVAAPRQPTPDMFDQAHWVETRTARLYDRVDVASSDFMKINGANFRLRWDEIVRLDYQPGRKWGMGTVPHSGRLLARLKSGKTRELILLGNQDGAALKARLERMMSADTAPASNIVDAARPMPAKAPA